MFVHASNVGPEISGGDRADHLRKLIESEYPILFRRVGALIYRICGRLRREEAEERIAEILNEAAKRALEAANRFDAERSTVAWLMGFALRILQERRRGQARRAIVQSDLGDEAWRHVLEELCAVDSDATTIRLDIRQMLARLAEPQRRILELRYFEGLDGEELARAVDAPTAGAARVRLARALQALRRQFGLAEDGERP